MCLKSLACQVLRHGCSVGCSLRGADALTLGCSPAQSCLGRALQLSGLWAAVNLSVRWGREQDSGRRAAVRAHVSVCLQHLDGGSGRLGPGTPPKQHLAGSVALRDDGSVFPVVTVPRAHKASSGGRWQVFGSACLGEGGLNSTARCVTPVTREDGIRTSSPSGDSEEASHIGKDFESELHASGDTDKSSTALEAWA